MSKYKRSLVELRDKAVFNWPKELLDKAGEASILPLLLRTQDKFISILTLADSDPESWQKLVDLSLDMPGNLFLKHLMVLSDLGGESLNKYPPISKYFKRNQMDYIWKTKKYSYQFNIIFQKVPLTNSSLKVDGKSLVKGYKLNDKMKDVVMLILYGATALNGNLPDSEKFMIGSLLGKSDEIQNFVKQNYIRVSRQISGATSTKLGSLAEEFVIDILKEKLPTCKINLFKQIEGTTFDIVVCTPTHKFFGIEVSFQYTTNSTIERKAREAKDLAQLLHNAGHFICHVIDGAGNINIRENAVSTICRYSDCTVAFSKEEIQLLAKFIQENS
ncbi:hypothetical protein [Planktothrix sp.]|uniref:hypothetical protein n=1 Tax=Planktothrix sp. TaxID=3088171 RepID=UPI0038D3978E